MLKRFNLFCMAALLLIASGGQARADLAVMGPQNPVTGFPLYYQDVDGLSLEICTTLGFCAPDPADPANPFDALTGFGAEAFWWSGGATVTLPDGGTASLVLAVEAAYADLSGVATPIDTTITPQNQTQHAFGRVRVKLLNVTTPGDYSITYPYGTLTSAEFPDLVVTPADVTDSQSGLPVQFTTANIGEDWGPEGLTGPAEDFSIVLGSRIGGRIGPRAPRKPPRRQAIPWSP